MSHRLQLGCMISLLFCLLVLPCCNQNPSLVPVTKPNAFTGQAEMRRGGTAAWIRIFPESILYVGDSLRAVKPCHIEFIGGIEVTLLPGTQLDITGLDAEDNLSLQVDQARIILTQADGTIYASPEGLVVDVERGEAEISTIKQTQTVSAGQTFRVGNYAALRTPQVVAVATPEPTPVPPTATLVLRTTPTASPTPTISQTPSPTRQQVDTPTSTSTPATPAPTSTPVPPLIIRVNCGGVQVRDAHGRLWAGDKPYTEGSWGYVGGKVYTTGNEIADTANDIIYQSERWGDFFYLFDVPNGRYRVTLLFAEIYRDNPEVRQFGVRLEGQWKLSELDLVALVGRDTAHVEELTIDLADGQLGIEFEKQLDNPKVNGIIVQRIG